MDRSTLDKDPIVQFERWYKEAQSLNESDIDAMALATASSEGKPSVRHILFKGIQAGDFLIFTNYTSRKADEMLANPVAALSMYWPHSYRQVRIEGEIRKMSAKASDEYFQQRPHHSRLAAMASHQSQVIESRAVLDDRYNALAKQYADKTIPCPDYWGGFYLVPNRIEFWQGRQHRLHDRFVYTKGADGWEVVRLAP